MAAPLRAKGLFVCELEGGSATASSWVMQY
jgi:hypothetical protein